MKRSIYYTSRFKKAFQNLPKINQELVRNREKIFRRDPFDPVLETHELRNEWTGYMAFSITEDLRIIFKMTKNGEIIFYNVGPHTIYKEA